MIQLIGRGKNHLQNAGLKGTMVLQDLTITWHSRYGKYIKRDAHLHTFRDTVDMFWRATIPCSSLAQIPTCWVVTWATLDSHHSWQSMLSSLASVRLHVTMAVLGKGPHANQQINSHWSFKSCLVTDSGPFDSQPPNNWLSRTSSGGWKRSGRREIAQKAQLVSYRFGHSP